MDVTIVASGVGNIRSVQRMCEEVGAEAVIAERPDQIADARRLILPGVGAFDAGMTLLHEGGWIDPLNEAVLGRRVPVLGICLGMQLLGRKSEEGVRPGLGWIDGDMTLVDRASDPRLKLPHMGWSITVPKQETPLLDAAEEQRFYYVHKYRMVCDRDEEVLATARYGGEFTAAVHRDNIWGVQFHPEKSHRFGMALMRGWLSLPC